MNCEYCGRQLIKYSDRIDAGYDVKTGFHKPDPYRYRMECAAIPEIEKEEAAYFKEHPMMYGLSPFFDLKRHTRLTWHIVAGKWRRGVSGDFIE